MWPSAGFCLTSLLCVPQVPRHAGPPYTAHDITKGHPSLAGTPPGHAHSPALSQVSVPTASPYRYPRGWEAGAGVSLSLSLPSSSLSIHVQSIFVFFLVKCARASGVTPYFVLNHSGPPQWAPTGLVYICHPIVLQHLHGFTNGVKECFPRVGPRALATSTVFLKDDYFSDYHQFFI